MNVSEKDITEIMEVAVKGGGYCDCEILFNARDTLMESTK